MSSPTYGSVELVQAENPESGVLDTYNFRYTPSAQNLKTTYSDSFILIVGDDGSQSAAAYVTITNTAPVLKSLTPIAITNAPVDDLASDPDADPLSFPAIPVPSGCGSIARMSDIEMSFTPAAGFVGQCSVPFFATDGVRRGIGDPLDAAAGNLLFDVTAAPAVAPNVTAISPATGPLTGGTAVTITGTGFTGATGVTIGGGGDGCGGGERHQHHRDHPRRGGGDGEQWNINDSLLFKPSLDFAYFNDTAGNFVDPLGVSIPKVLTRLGQFRFSPMLAQQFGLENGGGLELTLTPELIWNLADTSVRGMSSLSSRVLGPEGARAAIRGGIIYNSQGRFRILIRGNYYGIGARNYSSYGGMIQISIPLR